MNKKLLLSVFIYFVGVTISFGQTNKVYDYVDTQLIKKPKPTKKFIKWIRKNNEKFGKPAPLNSPETTKVTVQLNVDKNGQISSLGVLRGIGQGYDEAAYYAIKNNPHSWIPGEVSDGKKVMVKVYYQIDHMTNQNKFVSVNNDVIVE